MVSTETDESQSGTGKLVAFRLRRTEDDRLFWRAATLFAGGSQTELIRKALEPYLQRAAEVEGLRPPDG